MKNFGLRIFQAWSTLFFCLQAQGEETQPEPFRLATFNSDVTCPVGHPLLGGIYPSAVEIVDPLLARGFVLLSAEKPIVLCAIDWCEIRNRSYDHWRAALAKAVGTQYERVLVCCVHQHDAPLTDVGAAELLADTGMRGVMFDLEFEQACIERTARSAQNSLKDARRVTHLGIGKARVERIGSNRRVVHPDGSVHYDRTSISGGDRFHRDAPDGLIDPWLRTLSFWDDDQPIATLHAYATHPMSYYGKGGVSFDFVGMARKLIQRDNPSIHHVYVSGCSGDVTAGKYNDGSADRRPLLAKRLYDAMKRSFSTTEKHRLTQAILRNADLDLPFRQSPDHTAEAMTRVLHDTTASTRDRIFAAMGLASRSRVDHGQKIDFPCIDLGAAKILLFPGEAFVGYQLLAQRQARDSFVISIGYGECWPGYLPTRQGFADKFSNVWYWVAPGSDRQIQAAIEKVLP